MTKTLWRTKKWSEQAEDEKEELFPPEDDGKEARSDTEESEDEDNVPEEDDDDDNAPGTVRVPALELQYQEQARFNLRPNRERTYDNRLRPQHGQPKLLEKL